MSRQEGPEIGMSGKHITIGGYIYLDSSSEIPGMPEVGLPETFHFTGIDTSAAKITPQVAIGMIETMIPEIKRVPASVVAARRLDYLKSAARWVIKDHLIRSTGREMISRYSGKDAITGDGFDAGATIIYSRKHGTLIA
jgi:hypothetical protein